MIPVTQQSLEGNAISSPLPSPPKCYSTTSDVATATAAIVTAMKLSFLAAMIRDLPKHETVGSQLKFLAGGKDPISPPLAKGSKSNERPLNLCIRDQINPMLHGLLPPIVPTSLKTETELIEGNPLSKDSSAPSSLFEIQRRRKVSWKGLAVCAACCTAFNKMSELNQHYAVIHKDRLEREWDAALKKRLRRPYKTTIKKAIQFTQINPVDLSHGTANTLRTSDSDMGVVVGVSSGQFANGGSKGSGGSGGGHMCPSCNYCAKWPTELQKHSVVHATSRPFVCVICGNCYKWSWDLGRHFSAVHASLPNPYKFNRNIRNRTNKPFPH